MNKVKVGFFSFTEITDPSEHHSYNEWHQFDHIPENRALPGIAHGERWARTPRCAELHATSGSAEVDRAHYMTLYLMTDPVEQTLADFQHLGAQLSSIGNRFHRHRYSHLNGAFLLSRAHASPRVLVAPEAVPYRPNRGVYVSVLDVADRADFRALTTWYSTVHFPDVLTIDGVAGIWSFVSQQPEPRGRIINVYYLDADPVVFTSDMRARRREWSDAGRGRPPDLAVERLVSGPYEAITPGEWDWFDG
jgi:hypothetical protein